MSRIVLTLMLFGCAGGRLAELEQEQHRLRTEYDDLEGNVTALRDEMVGLGLLTEQQANAKASKAPGGGGPKRARTGNPVPEVELSDTLTWTGTRSGKSPALPPLPDPERTETECGWKAFVRELQPVSDFPLNRDGYGKASPILLFENDQPMTPHAMPDAFEENCTGSYRHAGYLFLFSPTGSVEDAADRTYRIALAEDFPHPRGDDDRPMYWIYPGTKATFAFDGAWLEEWGQPKLDITGKAINIGTDVAHIRAPGISVEVTDNGGFEHSKAVEPPTAPFTIEIESEEDGPYILLDTLTLGNPQHAVVITAEAAWKAR